MSDQQQLIPVAQQIAGKDDCYTPEWVFDALGLRFDLDVAAPPGGVRWVPADRFYTVEDDGLAQPWEGRVWMNPPFSNVTPWAQKFMRHRNGICLLPHAKSLWHGEMWAAADAIVQPPKRIIFVGNDGDVSVPTFLAAYGPECVRALHNIGVVRVEAALNGDAADGHDWRKGPR